MPKVASTITLGENIRSLRGRKGLTQAQLCSGLPLSISQLSKIEQGEKSPHVFVLQQLAILLDTTVDYLLTGEEVKKKIDVTKYEDRKKLQLQDGDSSDYDYQAMSLYKHGNLFPFFVRILKKDKPGIETDPKNYQKHLGEELAYVLEGSVKIYFGKEVKANDGKSTIIPSPEFEPAILKEWDTIHFEANIPHFYTYIPVPETDKERNPIEDGSETTNAKLFAVVEIGLDHLKKEIQGSETNDRRILIDKPPI